MAFGRKTPSHLAAKPGSPDAAVAEQGGLERIRRIRPAPGVLLAPVDRTGDGNTADRGRNPRIALQTGRAAGSLHIAALEMDGDDRLPEIESMVDGEAVAPDHILLDAIGRKIVRDDGFRRDIGASELGNHLGVAGIAAMAFDGPADFDQGRADRAAHRALGIGQPFIVEHQAVHLRH